jgi:exonuclease SbcC
MWVESVKAHAFGPFDAETLELAEGLTLIIGPNEAGKSSWHAALRAALCGLRRGRGRATLADAAFERQHRPWDEPDRWGVEARLHLDDGRTIEISQDLAGKVACRAVDVQLGRDVSDEIMDGTPDASRWLGLDRHAFAATVCVNQAQILAIADRETAADLQEHMQRAASTRGTDATAAEARERISDFRRNHVGVDRAGARGPLRAAKERVERLESRLVEARDRHQGYLEACARADAARQAANALAERVALAEAALATNLASAASRRAERASELAARHTAPPAADDRQVEADAVVAALESWTSRPQPAALDGPSSTELEAALAALPAIPEGDIEPHSSIIQARRRLEIASQAVEMHGMRPVAPNADRAPRQDLTSSGTGWPRRAALIAAAATFLGAAVAALLGASALGVVVAAAGCALGLAGLFVRPGPSAAAIEWAARLEASRAQIEQWDRRRAELDGEETSARRALLVALQERAIPAGDDPVAAAISYEEACRDRAALTAQAAKRGGLAQALVARRAAEESLKRELVAAARAQAAVRAAARLIGVAQAGEVEPEQMVERLEAWRRGRGEQLRRQAVASSEWQELSSLLDGRSLDALRDEAERRATIAAEKRAAVGDADLTSLRGREDLEQLAALERDELAKGRREADALGGALDQMRRDMPEVAEVEERLDEARGELERIKDLASVLDETLRRLRAAEERVHRDLAPVLADGIRRWLSQVTGGAYVDASVDPADFAVKVKEAGSGRWRSAALLSQGTREQIYLLLRAAMAQSLVTTGETAPLLLDEVTAQADARRTEQMLEVLRALSLERQVILFTHDERVAGWAERRLASPRDRVVRLRGRRRPSDESVSLRVVASA